MTVNNEIVKRTDRGQGFKVLGVMISFDNHFEIELGQRIKSGWRNFYKNYDTLTHPDAPIKKRLALLNRLVGPALFWCAGSWNLTKKSEGLLRETQRSMIRKMLRFSKKEGETAEDFMTRTNSTIKHIREHCQVERWDIYYYRCIYRWAGHMARIGKYEESRLTFRILKYKNWAWIKKIADQNNGRQLHCRILRIWRWERSLYKWDPNWSDKAQCTRS